VLVVIGFVVRFWCVTFKTPVKSFSVPKGCAETGTDAACQNIFLIYTQELFYLVESIQSSIFSNRSDS
jgi:hypothetical protein